MRVSSDIISVPSVQLHHNTSLRALVLFVLDVSLIALCFFVSHYLRLSYWPEQDTLTSYLPLTGLAFIVSNFLFFQYDPFSLNFNTAFHSRSFLILPFNVVIVAFITFLVGPLNYNGSIWGRGVVFLYALTYAVGSFYLRRFFVMKLNDQQNLELSKLAGESEEEMAHKRMTGATLVSESRFSQEFEFKIPLVEIDPKWILNLEFDSHKIYSKVCRIRDIVVSLFVLVVTSPVLFIAMLLIFLQDGKSPVFKQKRRGLYGKSFNIFKLRSMRVCQGQYKDHVFSSPGDCRVTFIGKILRKSRIDEIPQLYNVLRGDMSLIGPRPEREDILEGIRGDFSYVDFRTMVRPGITGWAQVKLGYCNTKEQLLKKFEYDAYYIVHKGFVLDLLIVLKTIRTILWAQGF